MRIFCIYLCLFTFWIENAFHVQLIKIPGASLSNLSTYFLLIVAIVVIFARRKYFYSSVHIFLFLLIFIILASIPLKFIIDETPRTSIFREIVFFKKWFDPILLFFILSNILDSENVRKHAFWGLVFLLIISSLSAPLTSLGIIKSGTVAEFYEGRAAGFSEPNQYASYLVLLIPLMITIFIFQKKMISKATSFAALVIVFTALITTGSRGGFLSFLFSMVVYIYLLHRFKMKRILHILPIFISLFIVAALAYALAPEKVKLTVYERIFPQETENLNDYSKGRILTLEKGFELFLERPIFGHGQRTFLPLMDKRFDLPIASHNDYLQYLVEEGFIGLLAFLLLLVGILAKAWNSLKSNEDPWTQRIFVSYITGFVGYAISMLAVNVIVPRYIFWFYTALIIGYSQLKNDLIATRQLPKLAKNV